MLKEMNGSNYRNQLLNWVDHSITDHSSSISCLSLVMCHCDLTDLNAFTVNNENELLHPDFCTVASTVDSVRSKQLEKRAKPATF